MMRTNLITVGVDLSENESTVKFDDRFKNQAALDRADILGDIIGELTEAYEEACKETFGGKL